MLNQQETDSYLGFFPVTLVLGGGGRWHQQRQPAQTLLSASCVWELLAAAKYHRSPTYLISTFLHTNSRSSTFAIYQANRCVTVPKRYSQGRPKRRGTLRSFASAFLDAVQEVGDMERIIYARVRDIIGSYATFVGQSGTFPQRFDDFSEADNYERLSKEFGVAVAPE